MGTVADAESTAVAAAPTVTVAGGSQAASRWTTTDAGAELCDVAEQRLVRLRRSVLGVQLVDVQRHGHAGFAERGAHAAGQGREKTPAGHGCRPGLTHLDLRRESAQRDEARRRRRSMPSRPLELFARLRRCDLPSTCGALSTGQRHAFDVEPPGRHDIAGGERPETWEKHSVAASASSASGSAARSQAMRRPRPPLAAAAANRRRNDARNGVASRAPVAADGGTGTALHAEIVVDAQPGRDLDGGARTDLKATLARARAIARSHAQRRRDQRRTVVQGARQRVQDAQAVHQPAGPPRVAADSAAAPAGRQAARKQPSKPPSAM